jgi:hypothetical protein
MYEINELFESLKANFLHILAFERHKSIRVYYDIGVGKAANVP